MSAVAFLGLCLSMWVMIEATEEEDVAPLAALAPFSALEAPVQPAPEVSVTRTRESAPTRSPVAESARIALPSETGVARLTLDEADGEALTGRVVRRDEGTAIEGAHVVLIGEGWEVVGLTDEEGEFSLRVPPDSNPRVRVSRAGFATHQRPILQAGTEVLIELDPAAVLRGYVRGPLPEQSAGAEVSMWRVGSERDLEEQLVTTRVDDTGSFRFDELANGEYSLSVQVPGWSLGYHHAALAVEGETRDVDLIVPKGARIHGRVSLRDDDAPVAGALVTATLELQGVPNKLLQLGELTTRTDEEGQYSFAGITPGSVRLEVETEWGALRRDDLIVYESGEELEKDFGLSRPASLAGSVITTNQQGVGFARVSLSWGAGLPWIDEESGATVALSAGSREVTCDVNGLFKVEGLPSSRKLLIVAYRGDEDRRDWFDADLLSHARAITLKSGEERENEFCLVFESTGLRGIVRDEFGQPLEDVEIDLSLKSKERGKTKRLPLQTTRSDDEGQFEFKGLIAGSYSVVSSRAGFRENRRSVEIERLGASFTELELELEACGRLAGWVIDQHGDSVPYAKVWANAIQLDDVPGVPKERIGERADEFGRFEFDEVKHGSWGVWARASGYNTPLAPVTAFTSQSEFIELELENENLPTRTTITGRLMTQDGGTLRGLRLKNTRGGSFVLAGDAFRIIGARAGSAGFEFEAPGYRMVHTGELQLPAGGELDLGVLEFVPVGELTVFVSDAAGKGLGGYKAYLEKVTKKNKKDAQRVWLKNRSVRHRFKGSKKQVKAQAAHNDQVAFGRWRLVVEKSGFKRFTKALTFSAAKPVRHLDVKLSK